MGTAKSGGNQRKYGRNKDKCKAYRNASRRERHALGDLLRHCRVRGYMNRQLMPSDVQKAFDRLYTALPLHIGKPIVEHYGIST